MAMAAIASRLSLLWTQPVGLPGEVMQIMRVFLVMQRSTSAGTRTKPVSAVVGTSTGTPPTSETMDL